MSIKAKMYVDDREINILNLSFDFQQNTDYNGLPTSKPTGGKFKIVFETTKNELFFLWMTNNTMKNVKIVFSPTTIISKSRTIELFDVFCVLHVENFNGINNQPMSTYIEISPAIMIDSGINIFEKYWKVSDLSMEDVAPTTINNEEEPRILESYFEDENGEIIENPRKNKTIFYIVKTENMVGESIDIDFNDCKIDFEYKGTILENDILKDFAITSDTMKIELKTIKQRN